MLRDMASPDIRRQIARAVGQLSLRKNVRRIALFGSHARRQATTGSDVDLLVEFASPVGFFELDRMQRELEQSLHRRVDLVTPHSLSPHLRDEALRDAVAVYEA
jgi:uncharacterized protein